METSDDKFTQVLTQLMEAFKTSAQTEYGSAVAEAISEYGDRLFDPSAFNILIDFPHQEYTEVLVENLLHAEQQANQVTYTQQAIDRLKDVYVLYDFIEHHIMRLIETHETYAFSHDKLHNVMGTYMTYWKTGILDTWESRNWLPAVGAPQQWVAYIESLCELYYGKPDAYLTTHTDLMKAYNKHTK